MKNLSSKEISFKSSLFYLVVAILSVFLGRIIVSFLIHANTDIELAVIFVIVAILSYILAFKIVSPFSNKVALKNFLIKILPLYLGIGLIIGFILNQFNLL